MKPSPQQNILPASSIETLKLMLELPDKMVWDDIFKAINEKFPKDSRGSINMVCLALLARHKFKELLSHDRDFVGAIQEMTGQFCDDEGRSTLDLGMKSMIFCTLASSLELVIEEIIALQKQENVDSDKIEDCRKTLRKLVFALKSDPKIHKNLHDDDKAFIRSINTRLMSNDDLLSFAEDFQNPENEIMEELVLAIDCLQFGTEKGLKYFDNIVARQLSSYRQSNKDRTVDGSFWSDLVKIFNRIKSLKSSHGISLHPETTILLNTIHRDFRAYQDIFPIDSDQKFLQIYEYKKQFGPSYSAVVDGELWKFCNQNFRQSELLMKKLSEEDEFRKFIMTLLGADGIVPPMGQDNMLFNLVQQISQHNLKVDVPSEVKVAKVCNVKVKDDIVDNLIEILAIGDVRSLRPDGIAGLINKKTYHSDSKHNKIIQEALKTLSKILLSDKKVKVDDRAFSNLHENITKLQPLYEGADEKIKNLLEYISVISIHCFMGFYIDKIKYKARQDFDSETLGFMNKIVLLISNNKRYSAVITDKNHALFDKAKELYIETARNFLSPDKIVKTKAENTLMFFDNNYPHNIQLMQIFIDEIVRQKLPSKGENYSRSLGELKNIFEGLRDCRRIENGMIITFKPFSLELIKKAITDCELYNQMPITNMNQALTTFAFSAESVVGVLKEKANQKIINYLREKIKINFGSEAEFFISQIETNNQFFQFVVEIFDDEEFKKLIALLEGKNDLIKLANGIKQKLKADKKPDVVKKELTVEEQARLIEGPKKKKKTPKEESSKKPSSKVAATSSGVVVEKVPGISDQHNANVKIELEKSHSESTSQSTSRGVTSTEVITENPNQSAEVTPELLLRETSHSDMQDEITKLRQMLEESQRANQKLTTDLEAERKKSQKLEQENQNLSRRLEGFVTKTAKLEEEKKQLQDELVSKLGQLKRQYEEQQRSTKKKDDQIILRIEEQAKALEARLASTNQELAAAKQKIDEGQQQISKFSATAHSNNAIQQERIVHLQSEVFWLKAELTRRDIADKFFAQSFGICEMLKSSPIGALMIGASGSQIYTPFLKLVAPNLQYKPETKQRDWDLFAVVENQRFDQGFFTSEENARVFFDQYFPDFKVLGKINLLPNQSVSVKLRSPYNIEFDLNLYPQRNAHLMHKWQYQHNRVDYCLYDQTNPHQPPHFTINNNDLPVEQHADFPHFVNQMLQGQIDIWQPNQNARKFLQRILSDSGSLVVNDQVWNGLKPLLELDFTDHIRRAYNSCAAHSPSQKIDLIKQEFCREYGIDLNDGSVRAADIGNWFRDFESKISKQNNSAGSAIHVDEAGSLKNGARFK